MMVVAAVAEGLRRRCARRKRVFISGPKPPKTGPKETSYLGRVRKNSMVNSVGRYLRQCLGAYQTRIFTTDRPFSRASPLVPSVARCVDSGRDLPQWDQNPTARDRPTGYPPPIRVQSDLPPVEKAIEL